jgi:hypothetical protein
MTMKNILFRLILMSIFLAPVAALAQGTARVVTNCGTLPQAYVAGSTRDSVQDTNGNGCGVAYLANAYPLAATAITGNAAGTTGAVVGTLAAAAAKTTYICGFNVSAIGGTAAVGPITIAGLITASMVYQMSSTAAGATMGQTFTPCIPASAVNTAITITTTADGTASAVNVNSWGYQQ